MCSFAPAAAAAADPAGWSAAAGFAPSAAGWSAAALAAPPTPVHSLRLCAVGALGLHVRSKAVLSTFDLSADSPSAQEPSDAT